VGITKDSSMCVCGRCIEAFRKHASLPATADVTRENMRGKYREQWIDFRCWLTAETAGVLRKAVKKANPDCLYTAYSGYEGPTTKVRYGVNWKYMSRYVDQVWCGYGRPVDAIRATHEAIGGRPFNGGELAWYGAHVYDMRKFKTCFFRRLSDSGSGVMTYFNWVVDGRFCLGVSAVASVVADFEPFFDWDIDEEGLHHSRYQRNDGLVKIAGEGQKNDATVLVRGNERLVFLFNEKDEERTFEVEHLDWQRSLVCVDYDTKTVHGRKRSLDVPGWEVRVLHVRSRDEDVEVQAPVLLAPVDERRRGGMPILAWQGRGAHPGDQAFSLEVSTDRRFPQGKTTRIDSLAATAHIPQQKLRVGQAYYWRVQGEDVVTDQVGPFSEIGTFVLPVFAELSARNEALSPNGDGVLDTFHLEASLNAALDWSVAFRKPNGVIARTMQGKGKDIALDWDGKDERGAVVSEGRYEFAVTPTELPHLAETGTVVVNQKAGIENPSFAVFRGFVLTVPKGRVTMEWDYLVTRTGHYSIRMTAAAPGSSCYYSNYAGGSIGQTRIPVTPSKKYRYTGHIKTDLSQGHACLSMTFFTAKGRWSCVAGGIPWGNPSERVSGQTDWTKCQLTFVAPKDADSAVLKLRVDKAAGTCWFDEIEFGEVE